MNKYVWLQILKKVPFRAINHYQLNIAMFSGAEHYSRSNKYWNAPTMAKKVTQRASKHGGKLCSFQNIKKSVLQVLMR